MSTTESPVFTPAGTRGAYRLPAGQVDQYYLRINTLVAEIAALIEAHAQMPIVQSSGQRPARHRRVPVSFCG